MVYFVRCPDVASGGVSLNCVEKRKKKVFVFCMVRGEIKCVDDVLLCTLAKK